MEKTKAVFIDDDEVFNFILSEIFNEANSTSSIEFKQVHTGKEGVEYLRNSVAEDCFPEYVIIDINIFDVGGERFLKIYEEEFHEKCPDTKVFILSKFNYDYDLPTQFPFVKKFIQKPLTMDELYLMKEEIMS